MSSFRKTYRTHLLLCGGLLLYGYLIFSPGNDSERRSGISLIQDGYRDAYSTVSFERYEFRRLMDSIHAMTSKVEDNPTVKIDTRWIDSVVSEKMSGSSFVPYIDQVRRDVREDEKIKHFDKARALHVSVDSFYRNELHAFSKMMQSASTDRYEQAHQLLDSVLVKIKTNANAFYQAGLELGQKYKHGFLATNAEWWYWDQATGFSSYGYSLFQHLVICKNNLNEIDYISFHSYIVPAICRCIYFL
jgi:hypothetical protein